MYKRQKRPTTQEKSPIIRERTWGPPAAALGSMMDGSLLIAAMSTAFTPSLVATYTHDYLDIIEFIYQF